MSLRDAVAFHALDAAHLPGDAELVRGISALAENVVALSKAPKGEDYSGPVLFEGVAGAQVFAEVLGRNLSLTRRPVADGGRGGGVRRTASWMDAWERACCPIPSMWWTIPRRRSGAAVLCSAATRWIAKACCRSRSA